MTTIQTALGNAIMAATTHMRKSRAEFSLTIDIEPSAYMDFMRDFPVDARVTQAMQGQQRSAEWLGATIRPSRARS